MTSTAELKGIGLPPSGILVRSDVSNFSSDELGLSDTTTAIRLKMIDGSGMTVVSHDPEERGCLVCICKIMRGAGFAEILESFGLLNVSRTPQPRGVVN